MLWYSFKMCVIMRKMLFLGSLLLFMGFGLGAQSDNCIVFGQVFEDHSGGQPIEGVHIICVENSYFSAETDANGEYLISILRNSSLRAEKSGYHISSGSSQTGPYSEDISEWNFSMSRN